MARHTLHDRFIRSIMADKTIATDYFQNYLPKQIRDQLDFSTLTQLPDSYISGNLHQTLSDIVYSCQKKGTESKIKIALLVEHKSYPDRYTPVQIGSYIFSGFLKQISNKEQLSPIIPLLLYHGKGVWRYQTLNDLFSKLEPEWKQFIPDFEYIYNNFGEITDQEIEKLNNRFLAASLLALKHSFEKDWLAQNENILRILFLSDEAHEQLQKGLIIYLFERSQLNESRLVEIIEFLPFTVKKNVMTTLDIFIKKGREEGLQKGLEKGRNEGKMDVIVNLLQNTDFSVEKIAALAAVPKEVVEGLRSKI